jgi:hypothetical protein
MHGVPASYAGVLSGMPSNSLQQPSRPPTAAILDAVLDMHGVPASHAAVLSGMPSSSLQQPSRPSTAAILDAVLDMHGVPASPAQRSLQPQTRETHASGSDRKRVATQDAGSRGDADLMPPPAQTVRKETCMERRRTMVTLEMLREWQRLGKEGIDQAGGLKGVAGRYSVSLSALRNYLCSDGTLTKHAEDRLNPPGTEITPEMLREWQRLGEQGIKKAGGLEGLARQYGVTSSALRNYLRANGTLTKRAEDRLNPPCREITDEMLREWQGLGRQGIEKAGGLDGLAGQYGVTSVALRMYLHADGTLTKRVEDRLNPPGREITPEMLWEWRGLGRQGIEMAGGLDGLARRYGVTAGALKIYLRADGTLTKRAEDRLNPPGTEITDEMLREWRGLGKQGIAKAGGLDGVAKQYGVAVGTLNRYLRLDGTLTKHAEDRLDPPGSEITLAMLREWRRLGKQGVEKAGGRDGVARQYDVTTGALRIYLRADGTLTKRAEERLGRNAAQPM